MSQQGHRWRIDEDPQLFGQGCDCQDKLGTRAQIDAIPFHIDLGHEELNRADIYWQKMSTSYLQVLMVWIDEAL